MSQVLGAFGFAGFHHVTVRSLLARMLENHEPFIYLIFQFFWGEGGYIKPGITEPADTGVRLYVYVCLCVCIYIYICRRERERERYEGFRHYMRQVWLCL